LSNSNDIKSVVWIGDSLKQVKSFPEEVRRDIGSSLYDAQLGDKPNNAKPFKGVGRGLIQIPTERYMQYKLVIVFMYSMHFQKNPPKGLRQRKRT
jgi:phage-related protein